MGRGNFCPSTSLVKDYEMVYVEIEHHDEGEMDLYEFDYQWLKKTVRECLPSSFSELDKWHSDERDCSLIAKNSLLEVFISDNEWGYAVIVRPIYNEDFPQYMNLAWPQMTKVARRLFIQLNEIYDLRVRNGPWMSSKFQPEAI